MKLSYIVLQKRPIWAYEEQIQVSLTITITGFECTSACFIRAEMFWLQIYSVKYMLKE